MALTGFPIATLTSGCVTSNTPLCFPTDNPRHSLDFLPRLSVTYAPLIGPGVPIYYQNIPGNRTRITSAYITLQTDATVVDRYVYVALFDAMISPLVSVCATPQTAGTFQYYNFAELHPAVVTAGLIIVPLARGMILQSNEQFWIGVVNMQAGDEFGDANLLAEQQIDA